MPQLFRSYLFKNRITWNIRHNMCNLTFGYNIRTLPKKLCLTEFRKISYLTTQFSTFHPHSQSNLPQRKILFFVLEKKKIFLWFQTRIHTEQDMQSQNCSTRTQKNKNNPKFSTKTLIPNKHQKTTNHAIKKIDRKKSKHALTWGRRKKEP